MRLNFWERLLLNNPIQSVVQHHIEAPMLLRMGGRLDSKDVLEIGCGRGVGVEVIFKCFGARHVTAIDVDAAMIELAKKRLDAYPEAQLNLAVGDAAAIDAPDETFDAVFDFGIRSSLRRLPRSGTCLFGVNHIQPICGRSRSDC